MLPMQMLSGGLNRSRSTSKQANHRREHSETFAPNGTHASAGLTSTSTPSDAAMNPGATGAGAGLGTGAGAGIGSGLGSMAATSVGGGTGGAGAGLGIGSPPGAGSIATGPPPGSIGVPYSGPPPGMPQSAPPPVPLQGASVPSASPGRKDQPKTTLDMGEVLRYNGGGARGVPATGKEAGQNPDSIYQTIQEASAKRISSLDYLKKTHEPRVFWFNTLLYTQPDIARLPSFASSKLSRRATNFLLLGVSLPSVVDLNTQSPTDYLQALNALLIEFEDYEKQHPSDGGSSTGTLTRARMPSLFKRSNTSGNKRRTSSAADIGLPMQSSNPQELMPGQVTTPPIGGMGNGGGIPPLPGGIPPANADVIPGGELAAGEDFSWLRTPWIPFEPDFFEVFVTLCDMLIECYSRIAGLVSSPAVCVPETADIFKQADGRIRKVVFDGIIKEFVDHTRAGVKTEVAGIGKIILGGLM